MTPISLNRNLCRNLDETTTREWLITNGIGAYASGTVAGMLTRIEHGLFVAPATDSYIPHLLLAKIDEEVVFDQRTYYLGTNEYRDGTLNPSGFVHLETFRIDEGFPVFTYRLGGIDGMILEKRIWMQAGHNSTYIQYRLVRTTKEEASGHRRSGITGALSNTPTQLADEPQTLTLTLLPFTSYRPYNEHRHGSHQWQFQVRQLRQAGQLAFSVRSEDDYSEYEMSPLLPEGVVGCTIQARDDATPYHLLAVGQAGSNVTFLPTNLWYWNFQHRYDAAHGRPALDDLYLPGVIRATLWPGEDVSLTIIVSTEDVSSHVLVPEQLHRSYQRSVEGQRQIFSGALTQRYFGDGGEAARAHTFSNSAHSLEDETYLRYLSQATERFLVQQQLPTHDESLKVFDGSRTLFTPPEHTLALLSNYYGMQRYTRDTLMALPGLLLSRKHTRGLAQVLRELARHFKHGLLPDIVPLPGETALDSEYRSIDLPLWYCYALDAYLQTTHDDALLTEVYRPLAQSIESYVRGTLHDIHVDEQDSLLTSTHALTWMNAMYDGTPVTPRTGKAVEVNALWYNALSLMSEWSQRLYRSRHINYHDAPTTPYRELLVRCHESFNRRFWHTVKDDNQQHADGYLFDVVDGPSGDDGAIRPNQLFALSLPYPILARERRAAVLDTVTRYLLTPYGLRTLAPHDAHYQGRIPIREQEQAHALHQGSVWTWLLGPYIDAAANVGLDVGNGESGTGRSTGCNELDPYRKGMSNEEQRRGNERCHEYIVRRGLQILNMQQETLSKGLLGMCGSIFNGDAPFVADDVAASLLSTSELLRAYSKLLVTQVETATPYKVASRSQ